VLTCACALQEDEILRRAVALHDGKNWKKIGECQAQRRVWGRSWVRQPSSGTQTITPNT
jgi:hypothetical protein